MEITIPFLYKNFYGDKEVFILQTINHAITQCRKLGWNIFEVELGHKEADQFRGLHMGSANAVEKDGYIMIEEPANTFGPEYFHTKGSISKIWFNLFTIRRIDTPSAINLKCKPWTQEDQQAFFNKNIKPILDKSPSIS